MSKIKNALISVSNKENLKLILHSLKKNKINIISSGGTYETIKKLGYQCKEISQYTGFKEMLDGRVKTLHLKFILEFFLKEIKKPTENRCKKNALSQ